MGKAKRAKLKKIEEQQRAERLAAQKRAERKETAKITLVVVSILLVIAIIVSAVCLTVIAVRSTGNYLRNKISVTSDNYEINNAMLSYYFRDSFNSSYSYYQYYGSYFGLDVTMPLKSQTYSGKTSWFDYFMNSTLSNVTTMLVRAEAAKAEGITLSEGDIKRIDNTIDAINRAAKNAGMTTEKYIYESYGLGVKESDIRKALELYFISQVYLLKTVDALEISKEDMDKYFEENSDDYQLVDYKVYTFNVSDYKDDEMKPELNARKLKEAKTSEEFDEILRELIKDRYTDDKELDEAIENTLTEKAAKVKDQEYSEWLFDEDRKVGDTNSIKDSSGNYSVYMLVKEQHLDETATKNVRHILFNFNNFDDKDACRAEAERILAEFKAGDKSEASFAKLAERYSADTGSAAIGGLYEDISLNQMVEAFEDWCFDEDRKTGDVDIIETSYGYHIMYFVSDGHPVWEAGVYSSVQSEKYNDIAEELEDKYVVTINEKLVSKVPDVN